MRPVHPGEILKDELDYLGMSARAFAEALDVPPNRITRVLNGQRAVTADTALRLARYFAGTSAKFWLSLQTRYDLGVAERDGVAAGIAKAVKPLQVTAEMQDRLDAEKPSKPGKAIKRKPVTKAAGKNRRRRAA